MMTFPQAKLAQQHPDWILVTDNEEKPIDKHWWLDPNNPQVQEYFVNLLTEVVRAYPDLYGIQLDDHWGIPVQFGNKMEAMTELTRQVVAAVRKIRPDLVISLSPNPLGFSRKKYAQDWLAWINEELINELVMQLYLPTSAEVALAMNNSILAQISPNIDVAVGIYAGGLRGQKPLAEIQQQISTVKQYGYGYAIFPWKTSFGLLRQASTKDKDHFLKAV